MRHLGVMCEYFCCG